MYFKVDSANVSWERVENEVVAIQLNTGRYYNIQDTAADIWIMLTIGTSLDDITKEFSDLSTLPDCYEEEIRNYMEACLHAKLILQTDESSKLELEKLPKEMNLGWKTPKLIEYSDLQDLILVDPIHDVEESGWPDILK